MSWLISTSQPSDWNRELGRFPRERLLGSARGRSLVLEDSGVIGRCPNLERETEINLPNHHFWHMVYGNEDNHKLSELEIRACRYNIFDP